MAAESRRPGWRRSALAALCAIALGAGGASAAAVRPRNGAPWPASLRPYAPTSPWNRPLPAHPRLLANSEEMVESAYAEGPGDPVMRTQEAGEFDGTKPIFFASRSDPRVTTKCTVYCRPGEDGAEIRIPAKARPAEGGDHHLGVVQPDGTEYDFWEAEQNATSRPYSGSVPRDWRNGDVIGYGGGGPCSNFFTGSGFQARGGPTAGGACLAAGRIDASNLAAGVIPHALFLVVRCVANGWSVPPANQSFSDTRSNCLGNPRAHVPLGARIWLDMPNAEIRALRLTQAETVYLEALHRYGAYVMDESGCGKERCASEGPLVGFESLDPPMEARAYGRTPPGDRYALEHRWMGLMIHGGAGPRYILKAPWRPPIDFRRHLHVVDPCYATGRC